ncbi:helix-turn-helix domain-containing protein [Streptomyces sp. NPDC002680]|uniref:helix-turn-helix domain-containing protein n=1 Tax=Streptomyces sp. NPDC002680 TaxID=3364659 RepID=UPI0036977B5F
MARIRKQRGLAQQGLAMRSNISKSLLSKVECGQKPASPALVAACARARWTFPRPTCWASRTRRSCAAIAWTR